MAQELEMGRLLRAGTSAFVVGCRVSQLAAPAFGALVRAPLAGDIQVYGLIFDIHIEDDGLVRQLVTAETVSDEVLLDNRERRVVPVELSVVVVGWEQAGKIHYQLPPRPPLSLDAIYLCGQDDLRKFTSTGRLGYFRLILHAPDVPVAELLAAHMDQARSAHPVGDGWTEAAIEEIIALLRDDYPLLTSVLAALDQVVDRR